MSLLCTTASLLCALPLGPAPHQRPEVWKSHIGGNGHAYLLVGDSDTSWQEAQAQARAAGGDLVAISTAEEQAWIVANILSGPHSDQECSDGLARYWIGLGRREPSGATEQAAWSWVDGTEVGFTSWMQAGDASCGKHASMNRDGHWFGLDSTGCVSGFIIEWSVDCDNDGRVDICQILDGELEDVDGDGRPDCCGEHGISSLDCDGDGVPDSCSSEVGALDIDSDGNPDDCERNYGDLDLNGIVDAADLALMLSIWGQSGWLNGDLNGDGVVGSGDLALLLSRLGSTPPWATRDIESVTPSAGPILGGTTISITGSGFSAPATVRVGGVSATSVTVVSPSLIRAKTPAGALGAKDVEVIVPSGGWTLTAAFEYLAAPTIMQASPAAGPISGGTAITISGTNFVAPATVKFGTKLATAVAVVSPTTITAVAPAAAAGVKSISVTTAGGTAVCPNCFTQVSPPAVGSISPPRGLVNGGETVTISGLRLGTATSISFGGVAATSFTIESPTTIRATTPKRPPGPCNLTITTAGGTNSTSPVFTYLGTPTVESVTPDSGPLAGGKTITIVGSGFAPPATVMIGAAAATNVRVLSYNRLTAVVPAGIAGPASVVVATPGGTVEAPNAYTRLPRPSITAVAPTAGPIGGGAPLLITGTDFAFPMTVRIGTKLATNVTVLSPTQLTAIAPSGTAGPKQVTVVTRGGSAAKAAAFSFVAAPSIGSVTPSQGTVAGGSTVLIRGARLAGATSVTFDGLPASSFTVNANGTITAVTPSHAPGAVAVSVTTPGGSRSKSSAFSFFHPSPAIAVVSPTAGPLAGGTPITITGSNFTEPATVQIGGVPATQVRFLNGSTITAVVPAGAPGLKNVTVTTPGGTTTRENAFEHAPLPTLASVSPSAGPTTGGTVITLSGMGFIGPAAVSVGGLPATSVSVSSNTTITAVAPAGTAGAKSVTVSTPGGVATLGSAFTLVAAPTVSSVAPSFGPTTGGTLITISGSNFTDPVSVTVGGIAASSVTRVNSSTISALTPAGSPGSKPVSVATPGGSVTVQGGFTYAAAPVVTGIAPNSGPTAGGTSISITGSNFAAPIAVSIGGTSAMAVAVLNSETISAVTPPGAAGARNVVVTSQGLSATLSNGFAYLSAPTIASVTPNAGSTSGGVPITITGTNFVAPASVTVGGATAVSVSVVNSNTITAVTPPGTAGARSVAVTTPGGTATLGSGFTYISTWYSILEYAPDPSIVTNTVLRNAIVATGKPWRVRDVATDTEFVLVPPSSFAMGCTASDFNSCGGPENPPHAVTLTNALYVSRFEVTQAQWAAVIGSNPSYHQGASFPNSQTRPVEQVSWNAIQAYLAATGFRLLTEAEWEFACRGGTTTAYHGNSTFPSGTSIDTQGSQIGWNQYNGGFQTHVVGLKPPNGLGLHDMAGNVFEWCSDWYMPDYYSNSPSVNPAGPTTGMGRVTRGGSYQLVPQYMRSSSRGYNNAADTYPALGFRVGRAP